MPNPTPAKYTKQLGPMVTPELAAELEADAREDGVSISTLVRGWIEERAAIERAKRELTRTPAQRREWKRTYDGALAKTTAQGAEHVRRHRDSDAAARGRTAPVKHATNTPSTVDS
jgi:hypothetical protein